MRWYLLGAALSALLLFVLAPLAARLRRRLARGRSLARTQREARRG